MTRVPLRARPVDALYFAYFVLHLVASLCVDSACCADSSSDRARAHRAAGVPERAQWCVAAHRLSCAVERPAPAKCLGHALRVVPHGGVERVLRAGARIHARYLGNVEQCVDANQTTSAHIRG